ncbi:MAG: hypothetical protein J5850_01740, partial [Clostridia bacterium]|nr:hypothetical protein [Clostridia bacterium]
MTGNRNTEWYADPTTNYGVMIKAENESAANHIMQFASSDFELEGAGTGYEAYRPLLTVNYRNCTGIEDYWSYTAVSTDKGTGYINNYNGNLTFSVLDASFTSLLNGFTVSHNYNSCNTISNYEQNTAVKYGNGWKLNFSQTLSSVTVNGNDSVKYLFTDGDGTKHYFIETDDGSIVDEDGLGYTFKAADQSDGYNRLVDKEKNVLRFDSAGNLYQISDANGNTITVGYNQTLNSITTTSGGNISFGYNNGYLTS